MDRLDQFDFHLPQELIGRVPASPRDSARLFVYDTRADEVCFDVFRNLHTHLPTPSLLVFNNTKVVPARLWLKRETLPARGQRQAGGGKIQVLLMMNELKRGDSSIKGVVDRKLFPGAKLYFKSGAYLEAVRQEEQFFFFKPSVSKGNLWSLLSKEGVTPIPPYIKGNTLPEHTLREKYQSVLAKHPASVAAPTASLHFTERLLQKLGQEKIARTEITLHVGAGTFAPITDKNFRTKKLFTELYDISHHSAEVIGRTKKARRPVIPVGTTALRTLESVARKEGRVTSGSGETDIFIHHPFPFRVADGLITNFHVPRSSLLLLVDAFLRHKKAKRTVLELYDIAIREKFRFYSFGDGMLIR